VIYVVEYLGWMCLSVGEVLDGWRDVTLYIIYIVVVEPLQQGWIGGGGIDKQGNILFYFLIFVGLGTPYVAYICMYMHIA
jgi:hypothetical protein